MSDVIEAFSGVWNETNPDDVFNYHLLSDMIDREYADETRWRAILMWAGGCTLAITFFGLFGLALLTVRQRTKEMGIRRVLGAGVSDITTLVVSDYMKLTLVGSVIGLPLAIYALDRWLMAYAYHVELSGTPFVLSVLAVAVLVLLTTGLHAFQTTRLNPVNSLRDE